MNQSEHTESKRKNGTQKRQHLRFHLPYAHLAPVFGNDWFALKAESFARFFGTPFFLLAQSLIVVFWIAINQYGLTEFDKYPFILLNLAFSLQAAYAAPLILLAQTRQADRDKANAEADALHREALAQESAERANFAAKQTGLILELLQKNTGLTETIKDLSLHIDALTVQVHKTVLEK